MFEFNIIFAADAKMGIGKDNSIPWRCKEDFQFFKKTTTGSIIVMGNRTWESLPKKPLPDRVNMVMSRSRNYSVVGHGHTIHFCNSIGKIVEMCKKSRKPVFVIGGSQIYRLFLNQAIKDPENFRCNLIYHTAIKGVYDCDTFFPKDLIRHNLVPQEPLVLSEIATVYTYQFDPLYEVNEDEQGYLGLLRDILENGDEKGDRTGTGTISVFGRQLTFSLTDPERPGEIILPLLTSKRMFIRGIIEELLFFLRGDSNNDHLREKNVHIWDGNTSREYLDRIGLEHYEEGSLGACFVAGTPVLTQNGYKVIEEVSPKDLLYTHEGNFKPICQMHKRSFSGDLIKIRMKYHPYAITSTPEHPYYAREFIVKDRCQGERNKVFCGEPQWIKASDIKKKGHLIGFKIEQDEVVPTFKLTKGVNGFTDPKVHIKVLDDPDEWFMMGYFVGDGWITLEKSNNCCRIYFAVANEQADDILPRLRKVLHIGPGKKAPRGGACKSYRSTNTLWFQILKHFGKYAHGKKIPDWVHKAPKHLIREFLNGYCTADGCKRKTGNCIYERYTTVSMDLGLSVQRLYLKLGIIASLEFQKRGYTVPMIGDASREMSQRDVYYVNANISKTKRRPNYSFIEGEYVWYDISSIEQEHTELTSVYNFAVEDDNTYTVLNTTVHNCYGMQWRHWGAPYVDKHTDYTGQGIDQLAEAIRLIREEPTSRRIIISGWNVSQLKEMALVPCHMVYQFNVNMKRGELNCMMTQRSADTFLGVPFNIASTALFTILMAKITGYTPGRITINFGDAHIYSNHLEQVNRQLKRSPYRFPTIKVNKEIGSIEDVEALAYEDFELSDYKYHPGIKAKMAV